MDLRKRFPTHGDRILARIAAVPRIGHSALGHVVPVWLLAAVFAALVMLTGLTVTVAQFDLGNLNLYIALAIAATQGLAGGAVLHAPCTGIGPSTR